ncbi:MAG TPA: ABC transporter ATP-binding protein [Candidatus Dependentiae bacterium]|nr:ABC transporter ATP-binding protein [Candidatus Dependentiae bacterium]HRQ62783.1 ABC transporter ATP-binding protein [Candidatus Dependentiae bacterium]
MPHPILQVKNLTKTYHSRGRTVHALNGISLSIEHGEIFGLLGVNGAGKTTLSSILATLHPPTSGTILFDGVSIYDDVFAYRKALGFCPQYQNLDPYLTVQDNLFFAGRYFLMPEHEIKPRAHALMEELEISRYADFDVHALSGGNKQRVLIARALMHNPKIVLLDEPTVGLDPDIRKKLWAQIRDLKKRGITVILTTHYLDEAEALSDRVCILHQGKVLLIEKVGELKARHHMEKLEDVFLHLMKEQRENQE